MKSLLSSFYAVVPERPCPNCLVCGEGLPPSCTYNRKMSTASDEQGGPLSEAPTTHYLQADGVSCRPKRVEDDATSDCHACKDEALLLEIFSCSVRVSSSFKGLLLYSAPR